MKKLNNTLVSLALLAGVGLAGCDRTATGLERSVMEEAASLSGSGELGHSAVPGNPTSAAPGAPAAPTQLRATAASSDQIDLQWTDNSSNEHGFEIWRTRGGGQHTLVVACRPVSL